MIVDEEVYLGIKTTESVDAFLEHFGVKGMKWGVITDLKEARVNRGKKNITKAAGYQKEIDALRSKKGFVAFKHRKIKKLIEDRDEQLADLGTTG